MHTAIAFGLALMLDELALHVRDLGDELREAVVAHCRQLVGDDGRGLWGLTDADASRSKERLHGPRLVPSGRRVGPWEQHVGSDRVTANPGATITSATPTSSRSPDIHWSHAVTTPRAGERAARERREQAARELAAMEARARRAMALPLVALTALGLCMALYAATDLSWAAAASAIAIVMAVRWLLGIPRARADVRPYRERFERVHAEHEETFSRFFAAEQAGTADMEPSPPTPPTVSCPVCAGLVTVANVQVRSVDGMPGYAATETDQDALQTHRIHCPRQ